jgi:hypothetical protein
VNNQLKIEEVGMSDNEVKKDNEETKEEVMQSGWAGPGVEIWPEEDDYIMWRSMKKNATRHLECNIPELAASPFCGKGHHNG